jgi:hypothetical protein
MLIDWIYSRRAARSSGEAFFLTSCNRRMAASRSTWVFASLSFVVDPCLLPKHDIEFDLELVLEFDLEMIEEGRPWRGASSPTAFPSLVDHADPCSVSTGERRPSLIRCRPFALRSAYLDSEDSTKSAGGEFVFVFGLDSRLWWFFGVLWVLPIVSGTVWWKSEDAQFQ